MQAPLCETIVDCPEPRGTEVLVRIERCGVCHSDLHLQDGYFALGDDKKLDVRAGRTLPFTLGHEIAGVVESAGPDAAGAKIGAQVAVYPWIGCGAMRGLHRPARKTSAPHPPSRHLGRRRLCHACAGAASALSDRLRAAVAVVRRRADVLGADRLFARSSGSRARHARARRCWSGSAASA